MESAGKAIPAKYKNLERLQALGVVTPASLLLSEADLQPEILNDKIPSFVSEFSLPFLVRSAVAAEDGNAHSLAGHFHTSNPVEKEVLIETIQNTFKKNQQTVKKLGLSASVFVMVQPYYKSTLGGVAFTRWQYFSDSYLIEFAKSPEAVVEGVNTHTVLIDKNQQIYYGNIEATARSVFNLLVPVITQIESAFGAVDIEWLYTPQDGLVVLQMRPVTTPPRFLVAASEKQKAFVQSLLAAKSPGPWRQNELSENVGPLSPLSFSLLKTLYQGGLSSLQVKGFKAPNVNWLERAPNGQLFCDIKAYQDFFAFKHWWSPIVTAYKKTLAVRSFQLFLRDYKAPKSFEFQHLQLLFNYWLQANVYLATERKGVLAGAAAFGDYELGQSTPNLETPLPLGSNLSWAELSFSFKILFFRHLEQLKVDLKNTPDFLLATWEEFVKGSPADLASRKAYSLQHSVYFLPADLEASNNSDRIYLTPNHNLTGIIWNPHQTSVPPKNAVYCAEIFENQYVSLIPRLNGIIVRSGSHLSHSAIVAREHNIPYVVDNIDLYTDGSEVSLG